MISPAAAWRLGWWYVRLSSLTQRPLRLESLTQRPLRLESLTYVQVRLESLTYVIFFPPGPC
jgi:hypothetical protein